MPQKPPSDSPKPPKKSASPSASRGEEQIKAARPTRPSRAKLKIEAANPSPEEKGAQYAAQTNDQVDEEAIRRRAYELWEQRGRIDGFEEEDWHRAEAELRGQRLQRAS